MKRRFYWWLPLIAVLILACSALQVSADNQISVYRCETGDEYLRTYVKDPGEVQSVEVQIGNEICTEVTSERIGGSGIPVHTYILLDNSLSIPNEYRDFIKQVIKGIVGRRQANEYISIATFDREMHFCVSDSQDNELLSQTTDGISFQDLDTRIPDVLYNFYQELKGKKLSGMARIILISDGMESAGIGYTKEEVLEQMTQAGYPVYAIGCQKENNQTELENMFRFSRATNADYFLLDGQQNGQQMEETMNGIFQGVAVVARVPAKMGDGSSKSVKITIQTPNGPVASTFTQTMPIIEIPQSETETVKTESGQAADPLKPGSVSGTPDTAKAEQESNAGLSEKSDSSEKNSSSKASESSSRTSESRKKPKSDSVSEKEAITEVSPKKDSLAEKVQQFVVKNKVIIIICIALLAVVFVILIVLLYRNRRKDADQGDAFAEGYEDKTELITDKTEVLEDEDKTVYAQEFVTVRLRDLNNPVRIFEAPLENSLTIGRSPDKSQIIIDYDRSVSGVHCELYRMNGKIYIRDLESANGTEVDNRKIGSDVEITSGCVIKLGRLQFEVNIF